MKLLVCISEQSQLNTAGVRIRYRRLEPFFKEQSVDIAIECASELCEDHFNQADVVLISKVVDYRSIVIAKRCQEIGIPCGIDVFDDYFSNWSVTPFNYHRYWFSSLADLVSFVLCSTSEMKRICLKHKPESAISVMNDTIDPQISEHMTVKLLKAKRLHLIASNQLRILWFGIGDNPFFEVGIADIHAFSSLIVNLLKSHYYIDMVVMTNERALTCNALQMLSKLPINLKIEIWSQEREKSRLSSADIVFLPISNQKFSRCKTANRCLSAMSYGCQVLTSGYPLYNEFEELIYNDSNSLIGDLLNAQLKYHEGTLHRFYEKCRLRHDNSMEVSKTLRFLNGLTVNTTSKNIVLVVIHGSGGLRQQKRETNLGRIIHASWLLRNDCNFQGFWIKKSSAEYYVCLDCFAITLVNPQLASNMILIERTARHSEYWQIKLSSLYQYGFSIDGIKKIRLLSDIEATDEMEAIHNSLLFRYIKSSIEELMLIFFVDVAFFYEINEPFLTGSVV